MSEHVHFWDEVSNRICPSCGQPCEWNGECTECPPKQEKKMICVDVTQCRCGAVEQRIVDAEDAYTYGCSYEAEKMLTTSEVKQAINEGRIAPTYTQSVCDECCDSPAYWNETED